RGERDHNRAVHFDDAPETFRRLYDRAQKDTAFAAWVFMIACAARPGEALRADWSEINLVKKLWTVPKERMKAHRTHVAPLNSIALAILDQQARIGTTGAVFPGLKKKPLSYDAFATTPTKAGTRAVLRGAKQSSAWRCRRTTSASTLRSRGAAQP